MQASSSPAKPKRNSFWPDVSTPDGAAWAVRQAFYAATFVAVVTTIVALLAIAGVELLRKMGADGWALVDAGLFVAVAIGLSKQSRAAAWVGLVLYVLERVLAIGSTGSPAGIFVAVVLTMAFIGGVRGANALHRFKTEPYETQRMAA